MSDLAQFRVMLDNILGTAADTSTWTNDIKDEGLRQGLSQLDQHIIYETDFTVAATGYGQDLSTITDLNEVIAVAYPWSDGSDFLSMANAWRYSADQTVYFENIQPQSGDTVRVRYTKTHLIEDLDAAASTTVASRHEQLVALAAGTYCLRIRIRQLTENPATPKAAISNLIRTIVELETQLAARLRSASASPGPVWTNIGL